jgi:hypothetical protein
MLCSRLTGAHRMTRAEDFQSSGSAATPENTIVFFTIVVALNVGAELPNETQQCFRADIELRIHADFSTKAKLPKAIASHQRFSRTTF